MFEPDDELPPDEDDDKIVPEPQEHVDDHIDHAIEELEEAIEAARRRDDDEEW